MPDADIRAMPFSEAIQWLAEHGEPDDPRADIDTASLRSRFPHVSGVDVRELAIDGPRGPIPARLYRDRSAATSGRALVWVHGGAFIGGHLDMPESHWVALELASRGIPVLAVDYVKCLGGVHFPVPSDDVLAALLEHAGVDATLHVEPGADHGHINEAADPAAALTVAAIADWIDR